MYALPSLSINKANKGATSTLFISFIIQFSHPFRVENQYHLENYIWYAEGVKIKNFSGFDFTFYAKNQAKST